MHIVIKCKEFKDGFCLCETIGKFMLLDLDEIDEVVVGYYKGKSLKSLPTVKKLLKKFDEYMKANDLLNIIDKYSYKVTVEGVEENIVGCSKHLCDKKDLKSLQTLYDKMVNNKIIKRGDLGFVEGYLLSVGGTVIEEEPVYLNNSEEDFLPF